MITNQLKKKISFKKYDENKNNEDSLLWEETKTKSKLELITHSYI